MVISKDALWKGIIESLIDDFLVFFFPALIDQIDFERGVEFLDTELQKLIPDNSGSNRHADKLIKVWLKNGQEIWFLIHVEVQGYQDPYFAQRMFECRYRIRDKYQCLVTGLAIYTDWERTYHFTEFEETFLGSKLSYQFNTYVLRDHPIEELAVDPNPFAAVMEAAWQHLNKPKEEQDLRLWKLDLIRRLKLRNISREKIAWIIEFIKYIEPFTNSEIQANFDQDLITLNQVSTPMGIQEAILDDVRKQGIKEGIEQGIEQGIEIGEGRGIEKGIEFEKREFTLKLWALQEFSIEKIALLVDLSVERVEAIIFEFLQTDGKSEEEARAMLHDYKSKFTAQ